jgi:hypothetical protein
MPIGVAAEVWYYCYSDIGVARAPMALAATERYSGFDYNDLFLLRISSPSRLRVLRTGCLQRAFLDEGILFRVRAKV